MNLTTAIELPEHGDCPFCAYIKGERPYTILCQTLTTVTLVTREQRGFPHLLVLPVRHARTILDLGDDEIASLAVAVREAAAMIEKAYARPGIAVWQNNGVPAGQAIAHIHFHVAGTLPEGGTNFGAVAEISVGETDIIANRIRDANGF